MEGIDRCRQCAEATFSYITRERHHLEERILGLSSELTNLESFINVLELQTYRPPLRQIALPQNYVDMRIQLLAALKGQLKIARTLMAYYTTSMMIIQGGVVLASGQWQQSENTEQHQAVLQLTP